MPITLGCPSCGKRFKARDESAGKRVKCPYCGAPVTVPTPEESAVAGAPTMAIPPAPPVVPPPDSSAHTKPSPLADSSPLPLPAARTTTVTSPTSARGGAIPAPVATPDDWGAEPQQAPEFRGLPASPPPPAVDPPPTFPMMSRLPDKGKKPEKTSSERRKALTDPNAKTADQLAAGAWRKTRGGLFWVLFALFFLTIPGFVGFAKAVLPRAGVELPSGEGWVIPGYVNSNEQGTVRMKKEEQIDVLVYAVPVIIAGLALSFGRLTCGAAPRSSGAKGMFALSGLFTFLALAALVTAGACTKLLFDRTYEIAALAFLLTGSLAEFWFLTGLACSGVSLKRPKAARAVGLIGFFFTLVAFVPTLGWSIYKQEWRPRPLDDDWKLYEQAAIMLGWLLLIGVYWRAVGSVRVAIRDLLESVAE